LRPVGDGEVSDGDTAFILRTCTGHEPIFCLGHYAHVL
jgi:hypothetical protein